jgi:DNA polymerase-3 subunit delta
MQVRPERLAQSLARGLARGYLVAGDETLLIEECCDAIVAAARTRGYAERTVLDAETGFEWGALREAAGSRSLFAERRILDIRVPSTAKAFGAPAGAALSEYFERADDDTLLLVRTGHLDGEQRRSKWFASFDAAGVVVIAWPLGRAELGRWLAERCRGAGLALEREALDLLAESTEGNLLAAAQEIEKLRLLDLPQPITLDALRGAVLDASHFDGFDLLDAALGGEAARARRILGVLAEAGEAPLAVLGQLTWWTRRLATGAAGGMAPQRARLVESARGRLRGPDIEAVLTLAERVDRQVKGASVGDPWRTLETLVLRLAGVTLPVD